MQLSECIKDDAWNVVWIVGEPGVGKTTFVREYLNDYLDLFKATVKEVTRPKWTEFGSAIAAVGTWRGDKFDGGDTVPICDIKYAIQYYLDNYVYRPVVILDGDKFSNNNVVKIIRNWSSTTHLVCVHLIGLHSAFDGRLKRGTSQDEQWVTGRRTKSKRFAESFPGTVFTIDRDAQEVANGIQEARGG